jgi:molecular chaperone DnaK
VEIEVTFEINADGIVSVHAKDLETGKEQSITVTATSGLTREEIEAMIDAGKEFAVERKRDEEYEARKQEAEGLMHEIERLFDKVSKVVGGSDYGRDALDKAQGVIERTKVAIDRHDSAALKEQVEACPAPSGCSREWWRRPRGSARELILEDKDRVDGNP